MTRLTKVGVDVSVRAALRASIKGLAELRLSLVGAGVARCRTRLTIKVGGWG